MTPTTLPPSPETPDVSLAPASRNPLQAIWQRKSLVLLGLVVGLVLAGFYCANATPVYQSTAQVLVVKKRSDAVQIAGGDPRMSFYDDYVSTHLVLIRSPLVVGRAVKKRELRKLRSFAGQGDPTGIIIGSLTAGRDSKKDSSAMPNNIINLSYQGPIAGECKVILNAVIDSYKDFLDETYRNVSDNTLELITKARDLLQKDLLEKERKYRAFRHSSPPLWKGKDGANIHQTRIAEFEGKRSALLIREGELSERLSAVEKARQSKGNRAALLALTAPAQGKEPDANSSSRRMEEQLFLLLLQEQQLLEDYGDDHPQVMSVRKKIAMTRRFVRQAATAQKRGVPVEVVEKESAGPDPLEARIAALKVERAKVQLAIDSLQKLLDLEKKAATALNSYEIQDEAYRTDIARTQLIYDQTIKRLQEINLVRDFGGYDSRIISPPGVGAKTAPRTGQLLLAGALLGLLAGAGLAYLADVLDKSFRTPEEIRRRLGLAVVGHIPCLSGPDEPVSFQGEGGRPLVLPASLCTLLRPTSLEAEAFRGVRTALYFSTQGERHKVVQVTSPNMGDGKSTLAANLAVSIAQSGRRVVLLDADFRRPRLHRLFGVSGEVGLASVINGAAELDQAVRDTGIAGLALLPCGPRPVNPAELLTAPRFEELLAEVRSRYDYVIVDTPPLLAVTDPCVVAPRVDGVLLTIRIAKNGRPAAERAREILETLGAKVFGVVVNGVGGAAGAAGGYGYEHYHYGDEYSAEYSGGDSEAIEAAPAEKPGGKPPLAGTRHGFLRRLFMWWG
jgi:capsular exopolysaccharide synthesis family protein